jgi:hypothetical protein
MKKNNTTDTVPTVSNAEKKRLAQYKEKKTPWLTRTATLQNYGVLVITLIVACLTWVIAMGTGLHIGRTQHTVIDAEGRGTVYTVEATVVATDNTLHTVRDTEGTLWLIDNDTLNKDDTLLLYIVDNNTQHTQKDDVIVRVWIDTAQ